MGRPPTQSLSSGAGTLSPDSKEGFKEEDAKHNANSPRALYRSKSCFTIKKPCFPPQALSSRTLASSTADFRSKSYYNVYSDRKLSDNIVRDRYYYGAKESMLTRRSLNSSMTARRRNLSDSNAGRKPSTSSSLGEKHRGTSNHDSLIENRRRRTTSSIIYSGSHNSQMENTLDGTPPSVSQNSRNEQRGRSSPNIRTEITSVISKLPTSRSSFNILSETAIYNVKESNTTITLKNGSVNNKQLQPRKDSFSCIMEKKSIENKVSEALSHTNLAVTQKDTGNFVGQNATTERTMKSSFFDCGQKRMPLHCENLSYTSNGESKLQEVSSTLNKPFVGGIPSFRSSFYVKQDALLPLRSHQLLSRQSKDSSFEVTRNPYYTFLPEFNHSSTETMNEKCKTRSLGANDSQLISSVLPSENLGICSKTSPYFSGSTIDAKKQSNHDANMLSHSFANCVTYFQHNSGGNLCSRAAIESSPYFTALRALSRMREDAKFFKNNKSLFNTTLLGEVKEVSSQFSPTKCSESFSAQRHSGTPLPVCDIIAKKVSSEILHQNAEERNEIFSDEDQSKQSVFYESKFSESSTHGRIMDNWAENKITRNMNETLMHRLCSKVSLIPKLSLGTFKQARENDHNPMKTVKTVFSGPASPNDCAKDRKSNEDKESYREDKHNHEESLGKAVFDQQSEGSYSILRPPSDLINRRNIMSSNPSLDSSDHSLPSLLLKPVSRNSNLGPSLTEFQYIGCPSCASSLEIESKRNDKIDASLTAQSQPLELCVSSLSYMVNMKLNSEEEPFLDSIITGKKANNQRTKDISPTHEIINDCTVTQEKRLASARRISPTNVPGASGYLPASSETVLSRPTSASESKPGSRRIGSPRQRFIVHQCKKNREQRKHSHSCTHHSRIFEGQVRQSEKEEHGESRQKSASRNDQSANKAGSLFPTSEGTVNTREIKVLECSKSAIDDSPLVLVSWDESANNELKVHPESVQDKRSYSLLYWNNSPSETKCTKQNFTNLIKRIMSTISSSMVHIKTSLSSESANRSQSAHQNSSATKNISGLQMCSNIKQSSDNRISICRTGDLICAHSINNMSPKSQRDECSTEIKTYFPGRNNLRSNGEAQNELSQISTVSNTAQAEDIISHSEQTEAINNSRSHYHNSQHFLRDLNYEKDFREYSQKMLMENDWKNLKISPVLPALHTSKKLFTQQLQKNDNVELMKRNSTFPSHTTPVIPPPSPTASSEWSMCIEYPQIPSKRMLYSWWRGKHKHLNTYSKLFDTRGMCYLTNSDEEFSSEDDFDVISWNE